MLQLWNLNAGFPVTKRDKPPILNVSSSIKKRGFLHETSIFLHESLVKDRPLHVSKGTFNVKTNQIMDTLGHPLSDLENQRDKLYC